MAHTESPHAALGAFRDIEQGVRRSTLRGRTSPFPPHTDDVRGFAFDVTTGPLREIDPA